MKKSLVFSLFLMGSLCLQASHRNHLKISASPSPRSISVTTPTDNEYQDFLSRKEAQAVFFAIRSGFDSQLIQPLVDHALTVCPSSRLFRRDVTQAVKYDSRKVKTLEYEINNGGCKAVKRAALQEQLDEIRNTPSFYVKK